MQSRLNRSPRVGADLKMVLGERAATAPEDSEAGLAVGWSYS